MLFSSLQMHCRDKTPMLFAGSSGSKVFYYDLYVSSFLCSISCSLLHFDHSMLSALHPKIGP